MAEQKTIVVTGVSRGLGLAMAEAFIAEGHRVIGCARNEAKVLQLQQQHADLGHNFSVVDVADWKSVSAWGKRILKQFGTPDLLINNAATINENDVLWNVSPEDFSTVIDVNIKGIFHCIRALVPTMVQQKSGIIVNISSGWGSSTSPEVAPYCATKYAVEGLTQALSSELPKGMAAIPLNPGVIHTELLEICFKGMAASYPSPADWAKRAVPFILNFSAKDNGQSLTVPG
ncbi:MAG: SDR family oxidoreductase [Pirellulales bacterium]